MYDTIDQISIAAPATRPSSPPRRLPEPDEVITQDVFTLEPLETTGQQRISILAIMTIALTSLWGHKIRALLTTLGIIIGVAAVVALLAIGQGVRLWIMSSFAQAGTNTLTIRGSLSMGDIDAIRALGLPVSAIAPEYGGNSTIVAAAANESASVSGVTPGYAQATNLNLAQGIFITDEHNDTVALVAVLGSGIAKELFGDAALAYGQTVRIEAQTFRIIGVLEEQGGSVMGSVDDQVFVPISVAHRRLYGGRTPDKNDYLVSTLQLVATKNDDLSFIQSQVSRLLRERHYLPADGSQDDFRAFNRAAMIAQLNGILNAMTIFLAAVAGLSLLVGGLGIMNIMLVSVTERTREIGLRKAIGAHRSDILLQFLVEALMMSLLGGVLGLGLGWGIAWLVTTLSPITAPVSFWSAAMAVGFSAAVGIFFGIYPAQQASRLDPIEALRYQ